MQWLRLILFVLIPLLVGCVTTTGGAYITPPESSLHLPVRDNIVRLLEKGLTRDEWTGTIVSKESTGILAAGAADGYLEDRLIVDVAAWDQDDWPMFIPLTDFSSVLTALRKQLVTLVESLGGTAVDWWTTEAHGDRTLTFLYKLDTIQGTVRVRMRQRTDDREEEMVTRFEITMREQ